MTLQELTALVPDDTIDEGVISGIDNVIHKWWSNNINIGTVSVDKQGMINNVNVNGQYQERFQGGNINSVLAKEGIQVTYTINF